MSKTTVAILAAFVTFVIVETVHLVLNVDSLQARIARQQQQIAELSGPQRFEVTKASIAELHRKRQIFLTDGNVLALKPETKPSSKPIPKDD